MSPRRNGWMLATALGVLSASGCKKDAPAKAAPPQAVPISQTADGGSDATANNVVELTDHAASTGDLDEIKKRGVLRVLIRQPDGQLPRSGSPLEAEKLLAAEFAGKLNLKVAYVEVPSRSELLPWLRRGEGDVVAASLQKTVARSKEAAFTRQVRLVRQQLVVPAGKSGIKAPEDLAGMTVTVRRSSSFYPTLVELQKTVATLKIAEAPEDVETEELMYRVGKGDLAATVADSDLVASVLDYNDEVRAAFDLTDDVPLAWAIRPENKALLAKGNAFLIENALTAFKKDRYTGDLDEMKKRKVLRVITRNAATTYFLYRGVQVGFEYEFAKYLAKTLGLRLEVVVPPSREELLRYLNDGLGDLVAAGMTVTEERQKVADFSRPYIFVSELVVARTKEECPADVAGLAGKEVHVRASSSYAETLRGLAAKGVSVKVVEVDEDLETESILQQVSEGQVPLTVADSNILDLESTYRDGLEACFPLGDALPIGWAFRKNSPKLKGALDAFVKKEYRGLVYNMTINRYFKNKKHIKETMAARPRQGHLSPYDPLVKKYSAQYDLDWRLMTAQMYQESQFDPKARSWVGAQGLFQVMPQTARELGVGDVTVPEHGIHAGIKYMHQLIKQFPMDVKIKDRIRFSQASYNAGRGHVLDAQRLAGEMKLNPERWFGNVEKAMLLLSKPQYARRARHGYCRGAEPVAYVSKIQTMYDAYAKIAPP